jgi:hypothetical protein
MNPFSDIAYAKATRTAANILVRILQIGVSFALVWDLTTQWFLVGTMRIPDSGIWNSFDPCNVDIGSSVVKETWDGVLVSQTKWNEVAGGPLQQNEGSADDGTSYFTHPNASCQWLIVKGHGGSVGLTHAHDHHEAHANYAAHRQQPILAVPYICPHSSLPAAPLARKVLPHRRRSCSCSCSCPK